MFIFVTLKITFQNSYQKHMNVDEKVLYRQQLKQSMFNELCEYGVQECGLSET